nr:Chain C, Nucleoprotein peptide [Influenza A virus]7UC5_F Chain F, Nucleoprotein peptide [Influenza A virus]
ILRGSVAHK